MDPLLVYMSCAALAIILLMGGLDKLRNFSLFEGAVLAYRILPSASSKLFAAAFVAAELCSGLLLLVPQTRLMGAVVALLVMLVATAGVVFNLMRGHTDVACGCGSLKDQSAGLSWWLVARNFILMALLIGILLPTNMAFDRHFGWVDGITFFGATLALLGLYYAANQLIESHVKLQKLKEI